MSEKVTTENDPKLILSFSFEQIAAKLDSWIDIKEPDIKIDRYPFNFKTPLKMKALSGSDRVRGNVLSMKLLPPDFPAGVEPPRAVILDTAENTAVSLGRFTLLPDNNLVFQLARFHVGYPAQKDMAYAARQSMQLPEVSGIITKLNNPEEEAFIVYLAREGPMINLHGGIFNELRLNIPYTTAHARHGREPLSKFKRRAKVCDINFEGLNPSKAKVLIVADNTASGMQHVKVIEKTFEHIQKKNHGGVKIERVLIVSPLLTKYGALMIAYCCAEFGIPTTFIGSGFVLDCIGPLRYFSPVPNKEIYAANPNTIFLNRFMLGDLVGKICSAGNWTARFSAASAAYQSSNEELEQFGITNEVLIRRGYQVTTGLLESLNIPPHKLIPYSSLADANDRGLLDRLQEIM